LQRSWRLAGSGVTETVSFTNPHKKKSQGVKSEDFITAAVALVDRDMLTHVWDEMKFVTRCVVYLLRIFSMFHGLMNNPVLSHA
jgi:hypothetical protein